MAEIIGGIPPPFALVSSNNNRVEPEVATTTNPLSKAFDTDVSLALARAYWVVVVAMHILVALFFFGYATVYSHIFSSPSEAATVSYLGTSVLDFLTPVVVVSSAIAICHTIAVVNALISSFRSRELVFSPDIWLDGPDKKAALAAVQRRNRDTWRVLKMLFAAYDKLEKQGLYLIQVFAVIEVGLQTFQANKLSHLVACAWINRLMTAVIVVNCWYIPLVHFAFRRRRTSNSSNNKLKKNPALEVLMQHAIDSLLDIVYGIQIPLTIFYPYYRDIDRVHGVFPTIFYYRDTWFINGVGENTQIFVSSWTDLVAKMVPGVALLYQLRGMQTLLQVSRTPTLRRQITFKLPNVRSTRATAVEPTTETAPAVTSEEKRSSGPPRGKIRLFFDAVLLCTGVAVLALHVHAESVASSGRDSGCLLEMKPWGSHKYTCVVLEVSCSQKNIDGDAHKIDVSLLKVEAHTLKGLIFSNCPALAVPPTIQSFSKLIMLKIHNATIAQWDEDAALTEATHPELTLIYVSMTNMSKIPHGLTSANFPSSVNDIEFCGTNLTELPKDLHEKWKDVAIFVLELSPGITEFPETLAKSNLVHLSLSSNGIRSIPDELLGDMAFYQLVLAHNPLQALPTSLGHLTDLTTVSIIGSNVSELPSTWYSKDLQTQTSQAAAPSAVIEIRAADTPLCAEFAQDASLDLIAISIGSGWFQVNCAKKGNARATVYPLEDELSWRAANR